MAKTQTIQVTPGQEQLQRQALEQRDRFVLGVVQSHKSLPSLTTRRRLRAQSIFRILAPYWRALSDSEKATWSDSGDVSGLSGWQAFISENAGARRIGDTVPTDPSNFHTGNVGRLITLANTSDFLATQSHPQKYLALRPVPRQTYKSELTTITEPFSFPISLTIRYQFTQITAGTDPVARYFIRITTSYQGADIVREYSINFVSGDPWREVTLTITGQLGFFVSYELGLELKNQFAIFHFDNIVALHSGTNWARDPKCNEVDRIFRRAFSLVSPYWSVKNSIAISSFASGYFNFDT